MFSNLETPKKGNTSKDYKVNGTGDQIPVAWNDLAPRQIDAQVALPLALLVARFKGLGVVVAVCEITCT